MCLLGFTGAVHRCKHRSLLTTAALGAFRASGFRVNGSRWYSATAVLRSVQCSASLNKLQLLRFSHARKTDWFPLVDMIKLGQSSFHRHSLAIFLSTPCVRVTPLICTHEPALQRTPANFARALTPRRASSSRSFASSAW